jgi:hypothetical protein
MATFNSNAYNGGAIFRVLGDQPAEITATIEVPEGHRLLTTDVLNAFRIGADHSIDEITARFSALDRAQAPTLTLDVGYLVAVGTDDQNAFIAASTVGRAGGQVRVENGGDDPFAVGALAPLNEVADIVVIPAAAAHTVAGSGQIGTGDAPGFVTITAKISRRVNAPSRDDASYAYPSTQ